jgi:hypothetical protein
MGPENYGPQKTNFIVIYGDGPILSPRIVSSAAYRLPL